MKKVADRKLAKPDQGRNIGQEILEGIRDIKAGRIGRRFTIDSFAIVRAREKSNLSQSQFAALLGVSVRTLQEWEQGRRRPTGPAQALLRVASKHPRALLP